MAKDGRVGYKACDTVLSVQNGPQVVSTESLGWKSKCIHLFGHNSGCTHWILLLFGLKSIYCHCQGRLIQNNPCTSTATATRPSSLLFFPPFFLSTFSFYHAIFLSILGLPSPTEDATMMITTHLQEQQQQQDLPLYLSFYLTFYLSLLGLPITVGFLPSV